jgi:hypothetical protein
LRGSGDPGRDRSYTNFIRVGEDAKVNRGGLLWRRQRGQQAEEAGHARSCAWHRLVDRTRRATLVADQGQNEGADTLHRRIAPSDQGLEGREGAGAITRNPKAECEPSAGLIGFAAGERGAVIDLCRTLIAKQILGQSAIGTKGHD